MYFENVGGAVFDAVLPLLNVAARVPLCGVVAITTIPLCQKGQIVLAC